MRKLSFTLRPVMRDPAVVDLVEPTPQTAKNEG